MKDEKLHNYCFASTSPAEKRLVFTIEPFNTIGDVLGAGVDIVKGGANVLSAGGELFKMATGVLKGGIEFMEKGYIYAKHYAGKIVDKIEDPGKPKALPDYNDMETVAHGLFTMKNLKFGDSDLNTIVKSHSLLTFLDLKANMLTNFYGPAISEFTRVEDRLNLISKTESHTRSRRQDLKGLIKKTQSSIDSGFYLEGDERLIELHMNLKGYKSELKTLEESIGGTVLWAQPEFVKTEYPPGSGVYIERLVVNSDKKVKVDLKSYYSFLKSHTSGYGKQMEIYKEEMEKFAYLIYILEEEAEKANPKNENLKLIWPIYKKQISEMGANYKAGIQFSSKNGSTPIENVVDEKILPSGAGVQNVMTESKEQREKMRELFN